MVVPALPRTFQAWATWTCSGRGDVMRGGNWTAGWNYGLVKTLDGCVFERYSARQRAQERKNLRAA